MPRITDPSDRGLTPEKMREIFNYDHETGALTWRDSRNGRVKPGTEAGTVPKSGNNPVFVRLNGVSITVARIIMAMHYGEWPMSPVRYRDRNPDNLRLDNLVLAHEIATSDKHKNVVVRELRRINRAALREIPTDPILGPDWLKYQRKKTEAELLILDGEDLGDRSLIVKGETDLYEAKANLRGLLAAKRSAMRANFSHLYPSRHLKRPGRPRRNTYR